MNENIFEDSFFFHISLFYVIVFLFCLHFCLPSHFKVIRCIVKSLFATSTYFLLKHGWKKKFEKSLFVPELCTQARTLFSQTAWICSWLALVFFPELVLDIVHRTIEVAFFCYLVRFKLNLKLCHYCSILGLAFKRLVTKRNLNKLSNEVSCDMFWSSKELPY